MGLGVIHQHGVVKWRGREVTKEIRALMRKKLILAAHHLKQEVRRNLSIPTRVHGPSKRGSDGDVMSGESPHRDTSRLHDSIYHRIGGNKDDVWEDVGTTVDYGGYHETHGRSFLRRTLIQQTEALRRIVG